MIRLKWHFPVRHAHAPTKQLNYVLIKIARTFFIQMRTIDRNKNHWFILSDSGLHGHTYTNTWAWACITVASNRLNFYFAININRIYNSCQTEIVCQLLFTRVKLCYVIYTLDMDPRILHKFIELSHLSVYVCVEWPWHCAIVILNTVSYQLETYAGLSRHVSASSPHRLVLHISHMYSVLHSFPDNLSNHVNVL